MHAVRRDPPADPRRNGEFASFLSEAFSLAPDWAMFPQPYQSWSGAARLCRAWNDGYEWTVRRQADGAWHIFIRYPEVPT